LNQLQHLINHIREKQSFLCVGLDSDSSKIPAHLNDYAQPVLEFNKQIIDATRAFCVAYKPNLAFYESMGSEGWDILKSTVDYIGPDHMKIADAKRGDIGNTADQYAKIFFRDLGFDAITIAPYMGRDSIEPFLEYKDKWTIVLGLTSNPGFGDFQMRKLEPNGRYLFEEVIETVSKWGGSDQLMFVVGATRAEYIERIRSIIPDHFLLVPGVGSQGGNLQETYEQGANNNVGLLINSSRGIIYAAKDESFAMAAAAEASKLNEEMKKLMTSR
jgi:orotidine-5'-phosphate decarboxylase